MEAKIYIQYLDNFEYLEIYIPPQTTQKLTTLLKLFFITFSPIVLPHGDTLRFTLCLRAKVA